MKYIFTYCTILGLIGILSAQSLAAEPILNSIPKDIQGNWSLPDCRRQEQMIVFGNGYILKIMPEYVSLYEATLTGKGEGYYILSINDSEEIAVSLSSDGLLDVGYPPAGKKIPAKKIWDDLDRDNTEEYSHCIEIINARHQPGFGAMAHLSQALDACSDPQSKTCGDTLFSIADTDDNKKLTQEEMLGAGLMLAYITEAAESESVPLATLETAMAKARTEISAVAGMLMTRLDTDKSKSLTRAELANPAVSIAQSANAAYYDGLMKKAKNLFPWLGK